jgi:hypothetical protein
MKYSLHWLQTEAVDIVVRILLSIDRRGSADEVTGSMLLAWPPQFTSK